MFFEFQIQHRRKQKRKEPKYDSRHIGIEPKQQTRERIRFHERLRQERLQLRQEEAADDEHEQNGNSEKKRGINERAFQFSMQTCLQREQGSNTTDAFRKVAARLR